MIATFKSHATDLPIDWEHQTLGGPFASPDGKAPAAGFIHSLSYSPGRGIMGRVEWNPGGRDAIRSGEYRYLSPVVMIRKTDRRAVALHSCALTNKPALPGQERLVASDRKELAMAEHEGDMPTPDEKLDELKAALQEKGAKLEGADRQRILNLAIRIVKAFRGRITPAKDKAEGTVQPSADTEVAASVWDVLNLSAEAGKDEVVLALSLLRGDGDAPRELAAMKAAEVERVAHARVDACVKENRLNPFDESAMAAAFSLACSDPAKFDALVASRPPIVPTGRTEAPTSRQMLIHNAKSDYDRDAAIGKSCAAEAYISQVLADSGHERLTESEAREFAISNG